VEIIKCQSAEHTKCILPLYAVLEMLLSQAMAEIRKSGAWQAKMKDVVPNAQEHARHSINYDNMAMVASIAEKSLVCLFFLFRRILYH